MKNGRVSDEREQQSSLSYSGANTDNNTKKCKCVYCEVNTHEARDCRKFVNISRECNFSSAYAAFNAKDREEQDGDQ